MRHTHAWIKNFLIGRTQATIVGGTRSDECPVLSGVPQGSVLGPLLFLLYINDLPDNICSHVRLFADDCLVYVELQSSSTPAQLQSDLDKLALWSQKWQLHFNPKKCFAMHITRKRSPCLTTYYLQNNALATTKSHPYLGIDFSNDLRWNRQSLQQNSKKGKPNTWFP
jgi:hypothetical protein